MRDARPAALPKLPTRTSSLAHRDAGSVAMAASASTESCDTASNSACSTPLSPTFSSAPGHARYPSSCSSLASTPPTFELDMANSASKLPGLVEDPMERDDDYVMISGATMSSPCLYDEDDVDPISRPLARPPFIRPSSSAEYDLADSYFDSDLQVTPPPSMRRQPSSGEDSPFDNIKSRFGERFPSLSNRFKHRKANSIFGQSSRSELPSCAPSSRSSSVAGSLAHSASQRRNNSTRSISEINDAHESSGRPSQSDDIVTTEVEFEPIDREAMSSTPLLPPLMTNPDIQETPLQSPLQSPSVADPASTFGTPVHTPRLLPSPPLSTKASIASFHRSHASNSVSPADVSPIALPDPKDEWAFKLGHANFSIQPEPYLPEENTPESCKKLFADWEQARCNFLKHQVKTAEHYGVTSKTYKLTDQKWAKIDAQWKGNHDTVSKEVARQSGDADPVTPREPAPLIKMPSLNDPKSEGKFPKLGDEDIVGPMVQIAAQIQPRPSRRTNFLRFLSEIKVPGSFLGRRRSS